MIGARDAAVAAALLVLAGSAQALTGDCDTSEAELQFSLASKEPTVQGQLTALDRSIQACPSFPALFTKARVLGEAGRGGEALTVLKQAEVAAPDSRANSLIRGYRGALRGRQGETCDGLTGIRDALAEMGDESPAWLGEAFLSLDRSQASGTISAETISCVLAGRSLLASKNLGVEGRSVDLRILFEFDSAEILPESRPQIEEMARATKDPGLADSQIEIVGHTDIQGTDDYNDALSLRRAEAVRRAVAERNPAAAPRLRARGRGEREPLYAGSSEEANRLNRRVEIRVPRAP